ncbi:MAG: ABC transporter permease [Candidatus Rokubacteria bacterium]|nr:ABC transporter permease [Candidatus Rokubacteria bacterium]
MSRRAAALLVLPAIAVLAVFVAAMALTGLTSFAADAGRWSVKHYVRLVSDSHYLGYLWRSFRIAAYCTPITLLLGYPVALVMATASSGVRLGLTLLLVVQFFTSYVIRAYALMLVLGNNGVVNRALLALGVVDQPLTLMYNEFGVAVSLVLLPMPFMVFPIYSVLKNVEPNLEAAATSLGADRLRVFWHVTFPLTLPGVVAGVVLVFLFDLTAYIMPGLLGGGYFDMVANVIYDQAMEVRDQSFAAAISMVLLVATLAVLYLTTRWGARYAEPPRE